MKVSTEFRLIFEALAFNLFLAALNPSLAADFDPFEGPKPIGALIETDPWLMAIGSDMPRVVIYEDGSAIWKVKDSERKSHYETAHLDNLMLDSVRHTLRQFAQDSLNNRKFISMSRATDLTTFEMFVSLDGAVFTVHVYGPLSLFDSSTSDPFHLLDKPRDSLPVPVVGLYRYLSSFKVGNSKKWQPKYLQVLVWPYSYAPDKSIIWPKEFPDLNSPHTIQHTDSMYWIFLPGNEETKLRKFLKTRKDKGAVLINDRKWIVSCRYAFPNEKVWWEALTAKQ